MTDPTRILLVHGFGGGRRDYGALKRYLKKQKHEVEFFEFTYREKFGGVPIDTLADELVAYIRTHLEGQKFFVVGFSQGGIIFRRSVLRSTEIKGQVRAVVTVCTPHQGTTIAKAGFGKGVEDLRPGSKMLCELDEHDDGIPYYAVYNPYDPVVVPGTNAKYKRAVTNKEVKGLSHSLTFGHPDTLRFVEEVFFKE
jgi:triacylglycerol lipase